MFQSAGRIIGWLKFSCVQDNRSGIEVSIRRADYWLVEVDKVADQHKSVKFQSAGRIIGWLKPRRRKAGLAGARVSIRRADYWLVEGYGA